MCHFLNECYPTILVIVFDMSGDKDMLRLTKFLIRHRIALTVLKTYSIGYSWH